ncbi:hypothetical protein L9F63_012902, partial [Diploptera punctata]
ETFSEDFQAVGRGLEACSSPTFRQCRTHPEIFCKIIIFQNRRFLKGIVRISDLKMFFQITIAAGAITTDAKTTKIIVEALDANPQKSTRQAAPTCGGSLNEQLKLKSRREPMVIDTSIMFSQTYENNGSGFIAENSGSLVIGTCQDIRDAFRICFAFYKGQNTQQCKMNFMENNSRVVGIFPNIQSLVIRYVGVCCPVGNENPAPDPGGLPGSQDAGQLPAIDPGLPGSGPGDSTTPPPGFSTPTPIPGFHVRGCGVSMVKGARIVGGQPADPKEWPWMAALLRGKNEQFCGGVLITDQHVLTAAHCLMNKEAGDFMVRLGEYDLGMNSETRSQDFKIAEIIMHEEFSTSTYENDIAILKLQKKTAFNSYIWPICLPPPGPTYENRDAIVAGWGTVSYGGPASDVLMEVSVPVWNQTRCAKRYPQPILETMMCAGAYEGGKDSCQGDSGGPLMLQAASGRWSVIGVVSWGIRCAEPNTPGIYTRVNKYLQWIVEKSIF